MTWIVALLAVAQLRYRITLTMDALTFLMHKQRQHNRLPPTAVTPSRAIYLAFTVSCITCPCLYTIPCCATVYTLNGASASKYCTVELGYSVTKVTEYLVSLYTSVVITDECNVTVNSDEFTRSTQHLRSRDSVAGIATRYGLEGPGIGSRWGEIFRTYPDRFRVPPSLLYNGCRVFPGGKGGRGVMLTTHPLLMPN
jgi:hypothetical protein